MGTLFTGEGEFTNSCDVACISDYGGKEEPCVRKALYVWLYTIRNQSRHHVYSWFRRIILMVSLMSHAPATFDGAPVWKRRLIRNEKRSFSSARSL